MTSKELTKAAVNMTGGSNVPLVFLNNKIERSDVVSVSYNPPSGWDKPGFSEWGFEWERLDDTMGQPKAPVLTDWADFPSFLAPNAKAEGRFDHLPAFIESNKDKYIIGGLGITGFNIVTFIRGFEESLIDIYEERDNFLTLTDMVMDFESEIIKGYCAYDDVDCISFGDDWGTQQALMINPALWRELYKERYRKQFDLVHSYGKHVFFHSCGQVWDILEDLIEIGADILNLNQPDIFGVQRLGKQFAGRVCFNCPVDHQTVAIKGSKQEIFDYVDSLVSNLSTPNGGFIGNIEDYSCLGMSHQNFDWIVEAFERYRNV